MSHSEQELRRMFQQASRLPAGPAKFAAIEEVLRHADAQELTKFAYEVRTSAASVFHHGGEPAKGMVAFAWRLAAYDRDPALFGPQAEARLRWHFKWVVNALPHFPDIALDRTYAVLDDMERRYLLAAQSLHAVHQYRWAVAHHIGDAEAAGREYDLLISARRDGNSDCIGCVPSHQVQHLAGQGRDEEAIAIGEPAKRASCSEQPHWIKTELLMPYVRTGRLEQAAEAHRSAYQRMRNDRHYLEEIGQHLLFCAASGNEQRGLDLVERHLPWLDRPCSPFAAMQFASAAAAVLNRLEETGYGDTSVRRIGADGTRRPASTVTELHSELLDLAGALAVRFDARNGTDHQSAQVQERARTAQLVPELPLDVLTTGRAGDGRSGDPLRALSERIAHQSAAGDHLAAARSRVEAAALLLGSGQWNDAAEAGEEALRDLNRNGEPGEADSCRYLLARIYRHGRQSKTALTYFDELLALPATALRPADVPLPGVLHEEVAAMFGLYWSGAAERFTLAARCHADAEQHLDQFRSLTMVLSAHLRSGPAEGLSALVEADAVLAAHGEPLPAWRAQSMRLDLVAARVLNAGGLREAALDRLRRVETVGLDVLPAAERSAAGADLAHLHLSLEQPARAETVARSVLASVADPTNGGDTTWSAALALVRSLERQERADEAKAVMKHYEIDEDDLEDE